MPNILGPQLSSSSPPQKKSFMYCSSLAFLQGLILIPDVTAVARVATWLFKRFVLSTGSATSGTGCLPLRCLVCRGQAESWG